MFLDCQISALVWLPGRQSDQTLSLSLEDRMAAFASRRTGTLPFKFRSLKNMASDLFQIVSTSAFKTRRNRPVELTTVSDRQ